MSTAFSSLRGEGEATLLARGFKTEGEDWCGLLQVEGRSLTIRVRLPKDFPISLPEVYVDRTELHRQVAHIEKSGKVCYAPSTGILLDMEDPSGIVEDALRRVERIICDGLTDRSLTDLLGEFLAYWGSGAERILSIYL